MTRNIKMHFEWTDGTPDTLVIRGDTIKEVRDKANKELKKRNGKNPWSEVIK